MHVPASGDGDQLLDGPQPSMPCAQTIGARRHALQAEPSGSVDHGPMRRSNHDHVRRHLGMHVAENHVRALLTEREAAPFALRIGAEVETACSRRFVKKLLLSYAKLERVG